jgi:predicted Zn-dependent peptidase
MEFFRRKLRNGMLVVMEKRSLPIVTVNIANTFGGAYESSKIKGISHVIEHTVFNGTKNRTCEEISKEVEKRGGILNAFTADELTNFWFKLPSEHISAGLSILNDILTNPTFNKEKFEKEIKVILEEIKMLDDDPRSYCFKKLIENLYEKPFGLGTIGTKESVSSLKRDLIINVFKKEYNPKNFIAVVVGNADFDYICDYFEKNFKPTESTPSKKLPIIKKQAHSIEARSGIDQAHFYFGVHAPLPPSLDSYAFEILAAYLTSGMSSKLFLDIREKRGLAYAVKGELAAEKDYAFYAIYVGTQKRAVKEVEKIIVKGFKSAQNLTQKELEELKEKLIGLKKVASEDSEYTSRELLFSELRGDASEYYKYEDKINSVKLADVKKVAKIKKYSTATLIPKT